MKTTKTCPSCGGKATGRGFKHEADCAAKAGKKAAKVETPKIESKATKKASHGGFVVGGTTRAGCEIVECYIGHSGRIARLDIRCSHPGCEAIRNIATQDAFQVKYCMAHVKPSSRRMAHGKPSSRK